MLDFLSHLCYTGGMKSRPSHESSLATSEPRGGVLPLATLASNDNVSVTAPNVLFASKKPAALNHLDISAAEIAQLVGKKALARPPASRLQSNVNTATPNMSREQRRNATKRQKATLRADRMTSGYDKKLRFAGMTHEVADKQVIYPRNVLSCTLEVFGKQSLYRYADERTGLVYEDPKELEAITLPDTIALPDGDNMTIDQLAPIIRDEDYLFSVVASQKTDLAGAPDCSAPVETMTGQPLSYELKLAMAAMGEEERSVFTTKATTIIDFAHTYGALKNIRDALLDMPAKGFSATFPLDMLYGDATERQNGEKNPIDRVKEQWVDVSESLTPEVATRILSERRAAETYDASTMFYSDAKTTDYNSKLFHQEMTEIFLRDYSLEQVAGICEGVSFAHAKRQDAVKFIEEVESLIAARLKEERSINRNEAEEQRQQALAARTAEKAERKRLMGNFATTVASISEAKRRDEQEQAQAEWLQNVESARTARKTAGNLAKAATWQSDKWAVEHAASIKKRADEREKRENYEEELASSGHNPDNFAKAHAILSSAATGFPLGDISPDKAEEINQAFIAGIGAIPRSERNAFVRDYYDKIDPKLPGTLQMTRSQSDALFRAHHYGQQ